MLEYVKLYSNSCSSPTGTSTRPRRKGNGAPPLLEVFITISDELLIMGNPPNEKNAFSRAGIENSTNPDVRNLITPKYCTVKDPLCGIGGTIVVHSGMPCDALKRGESVPVQSTACTQLNKRYLLKVKHKTEGVKEVELASPFQIF